MGVMSLTELRSHIDTVDDRLLDLLNERATLVAKVASMKERLDVPFYVPSRERAIVERLAQKNSGPFPTEALRPVFQEIMSACLSLERVVKIAYLGPEATYTHLAVKKQFGLSARAQPCGTIAAVFSEVEKGGADFGVVPVENSTEGVVTHTLDTFLETPLLISAEIALAITHCLLLRPGVEFASIERVYSHPQALAQCRRWLATNLPLRAIVEATSTAEAARLARDDATGAAIGAEMAAKLYDLVVHRRQIEDLAENFTRFLVIGNVQADRTGADRTSLCVAVGDGPGALHLVLGPFAKHGVNMTRIESRPSRKRPWDYVFFIDVDGHASDAPIAEAIAEAKTVANEVRILGAYPRASI
jgi:chorismate mutase/prephenate dehydratase